MQQPDTYEAELLEAIDNMSPTPQALKVLSRTLTRFLDHARFLDVQRVAPITEDDLPALVLERRAVIDIRDDADARSREVNKHISGVLKTLGVKRLQLPDGTVVSLVEPEDREKISAEKLLELGVSIDVIKAATKKSPVASYPRVDGTAGADAGDVAQPPAESTSVN